HVYLHSFPTRRSSDLSSSEQVEKMELSKRSLKEGSKILIIDDFLRGGGTVTGLERMAEEFNCEVVDSVVFLEHNKKINVENYHSDRKSTRLNSGHVSI